MSTQILPNPTSLQNEVLPRDDVQCDSLRLSSNESVTTAITDLHQCLIDIDEEVGDDELEGLKFLCRDHIPVSKLEKAQTALEIFDTMKKMVLIESNNVDYLLECLGRVHRLDLVRKLDFQPDVVRSHLHNFKKLLPFRVLMMDIIEDLDDKETEKIRFFLRGRIRKKILNDKRSLLQLFVFMEQEGLLAPTNLDLLTTVLESIKRGDLIDKIRDYQGLPALQRLDPGLNRNANPVVPSHLPPPTDPNQPGQIASGQPSNIGRSVSAGTISFNSEENEAVPDRRNIPQPLLDHIVTDLTPQVDDLGIELGFTNQQLVQYQQQIPDPSERTLKLIQEWQNNRVDKGTIVPVLIYTLMKLGCKKSAEDLKRWTNTLNTEQTTYRQGPTNFQPTGPPADQDNHCASMREAQLDQVRKQVELSRVQQNASELRQVPAPATRVPAPATQVPAPATQVPAPAMQIPAPGQIPENRFEPQVIPLAGQFSEQLRIAPNQFAGQCNIINNGTAVYLQGEHVLANPGISRELAPMPVPLDNLIKGQGQGQQIPVVGNSRQMVLPVVHQRSEQIPELPSYPMNKQPRGWCVIINNKEFHVVQGDNSSKEMPARNGTDKDAESLQHTFSNLGFIVRRRDNLSETEMMNYLIDIAHNVDHTNFDCFVCCILTHGVLNYVYGSNGKLVSIKDLTETFQTNRCRTLAGKPKLFFLQACQGRDKMLGGEELEKDMPSPVESDQVTKEMIPNEADFLLGYATVPGYVSFRSRNHGSWYIRKLCELLEKYAHKYDLMSILVEVNREVAGANAAMDGGLYKQIPAPLVTLRKQLYFK